jgi:hypothetical protein
MATNCTHLDQIYDVEPSAQGCEECLKTGDWWVHLRECLVCGHVGCCDSSPNRHATKHFHSTEHPPGPILRARRELDFLLCGQARYGTALAEDNPPALDTGLTPSPCGSRPAPQNLASA